MLQAGSFQIERFQKRVYQDRPEEGLQMKAYGQS